MKRLSEEVKFDIGLAPQALDNNNVTGKYFPLAMFFAAVAKLALTAMAAGTTAIVEFLQAQDAAGTNAKGIPTTVGQTAIATITANVLVNEMTVTVGAPNNGDTITINGVVFTKAAATAAATREFADAAGLETCVNSAAYGVPGITASNNAGVVTLRSTVPGHTAITAAKTGAALTLATTLAQAYIDLLREALDTTQGYTHVAVKVTTTATSVIGVELLRYRSRYAIDQRVGASAVL